MKKTIRNVTGIVLLIPFLSGCFAPANNPSSSEPTSIPTSEPTSSPTSSPTTEPTSEPSSASTSDSGWIPTSAPTSSPTSTPTSEPSSISSSSIPEVNYFKVTWLNDNGEELEVDEKVKEGEMPSYDGEEPFKEGDSQYSYEFNGWSPELSEVISDITYTATYTQTVNKYNVSWRNYDESELYSQDIEYGEMPSYDFVDPIRPVDDENAYTFNGWSPEISSVTSDQKYVAQYEATPLANGGFNFSNVVPADRMNNRLEILGKLEQYMMENHLAGIPIFQNGGYKAISNRVELRVSDYINGYGLGEFSEGEINTPLDSEENPNHKMYLHLAQANDPLQINYLASSSTLIDELADHITSSFYSTRLANSNNDFEYFPLLASEHPLPMEEPNEYNLYRKWRIYVKTGSEDNLKYTTLSSINASYVNRDVTLEDYDFIFESLLSGYFMRGVELASDMVFGLKGAIDFYHQARNLYNDQSAIDSLWNQMKINGRLGFNIGVDINRCYIDLEFNNPLSHFDVISHLTSNYFSPLPRDFILDIGGGSIKNGFDRYGRFNGSSNNNIIDYTLCLGPYMIEEWAKNEVITFKKNDNWIENSNRYQIPGLKIRIVTSATSNPNAIYNLYKAGEIDVSLVPSEHIQEEIGKPNVFEIGGDSTFKLNVNACDQNRWNELFGPQGSIHPGGSWDVKPWMSNSDFLNGLFHSINRQEFAEKRGVKPSIDYFSDAYLSGPENKAIYNSTVEHQNAVEKFMTYDEDGHDAFGYSKEKAISSFKRAIRTLKQDGYIDDGDVLNINITWMYQSEISEYGQDIKEYFEDAFNDPIVCDGAITLEVTQQAVTNWEYVYDRMNSGEFDLAFGSLTGNYNNPLDFLETVKSNNFSGFTLNWGKDTSKVDDEHALIYNDVAWSFDALWAASSFNTLVEKGQEINRVKTSRISGRPKTIANNIMTNDYSLGVYQNVNFEFNQVENASMAIEGVNVYLFNGESIEVPSFAYDVDTHNLVITIESELGEYIKDRLHTIYGEETNFTLYTCSHYWEFEVVYTLSIDGGPIYTYSEFLHLVSS